jgi:glycosyltransferase involved in cell wall biosynthesis
MEKVKGQNNLIYAMVKLPQTVHLTFAGSGSTEVELHQLVKTLNLSHRVHFLGQIDDMPDFYRALDIFCLPSLNEGYPLSPLEAQACNIQSAVTDVGASSETLCPHSGKLIPPKNVDKMALTLNKMIQLQILKSHISPRHFVQKQGDVRRMAQAYANLRYEGV